MTVEVLTFPPTSRRNRQLFEGLVQHAPATVQVTEHVQKYRGGSDWLMIWGPGAPERIAPIAAQLAAGGHVIAWDLAYWQRDQKMRCTIDGPHPQAWVMTQDWPAARFEADRVHVSDTWNPDGPVILAGIGPKSKVQYGAARIAEWEASIIAECRAQKRTVLYRRKRQTESVPAGATLAPDRPIDEALQGASLLATWHSNTAVDAIRAGVPVVCQDGAAAAVCPRELPAKRDCRPLDPETRLRFLRNLAWFQWAPNEAKACWQFLLRLLA